MAAMNTTCNPFIYAMFMPVYRKCVVKTFCGCAVAPRDASGDSSATGVSTLSTT